MPTTRFLEERGLPREPSSSGAHHVWFQGLFVEGDEVYVLGRARRDEDGTVELVATEHEPVALQHVDRDRRKARGPALWDPVRA